MFFDFRSRPFVVKIVQLMFDVQIYTSIEKFYSYVRRRHVGLSFLVKHFSFICHATCYILSYLVIVESQIFSFDGLCMATLETTNVSGLFYYAVTLRRCSGQEGTFCSTDSFRLVANLIGLGYDIHGIKFYVPFL